MKRRQFLRGAAAGVLGTAGMTLAACGAAPEEPAAGGEDTPAADAPAQGAEMPAVEWRCGTSWPISLDTIYGGATTVAERVSQMTGGQFQINTFPGGELFPGLEVLQNVQQGTVECGHSASYYYVGLNSALAFGTAVPFGFTAQQQNAWLYYGGGLDVLRPVYAKFDTINFPAGNTSAQMGGWFRNEVNTVEDLQGLKFRIPGLGGRVMERLGANVQNVAGGEIYQSLQTGAIDAAEWVGPYDDQKLGFQDVAQNYYIPGWWEPGPTLDLMVNINAYEALPDLYKQILETACYQANIDMLAKYDAFNRIAIREIIDSGVNVRVYSNEILEAAEAAAFELYEEDAAANPDFQAVYDSFQAFRPEIYGWHASNELALMNYLMRDSTAG